MEYSPYFFVLTKSSVLRTIKVLIRNMSSVSNSTNFGSEDSTTKLLDNKCEIISNPLSDDFTLKFEFCKPKPSHKRSQSSLSGEPEVAAIAVAETSVSDELTRTTVLEEDRTQQNSPRDHQPQSVVQSNHRRRSHQIQPLTSCAASNANVNRSSPPSYYTTRSPSASMKRKKSSARKCRDLSHYNSVPPIQDVESRSNAKVGLARSSSHTYIPLKSPGASSTSASTTLSYINSPLSGKHKTRSNTKLEDFKENAEDDFELYRQQYSSSSTSLKKSPITPSSGTVFKFPPSLPSPNSRSKSRRFSFSSSPRSPVGIKSPQMGPPSSSSFADPMPRSPSTGSTAHSSSVPESCSSIDHVSHCRRSTTDLTDLWEESCSSMTSISRPSSPARSRTGSVKSGNLAYLASRRGSRDSQASQFSNEDVAPLNFSNTARGRQRRTSNFLELPVPDHVRPRVCSLPEKPYNPRAGDELYRLRTFSITYKGGVVNCGDSMISRRSRSNTSVNSTASRHSNHSNVSGASPFEGSCCGSSYNNISTDSTGEEIPKYRVVLFGDSGVGKTALVSQFMTSEYMNTYDASLDDEFGEKTVSVLLDGAESEMVFIDHPATEMSVENSLSTYEPHACVVVYSVVNRSSLKMAEDILNYLWRENFTQEKSVIVVGNKADLARARVISSSEGKALAASRGCKFIETSSGIQHNVDELLVGILKQIRLRENRERKRQKKLVTHGSRASLTFNIAREIFNRICLKDNKSKSCENLHVL